MNGRRYTKDEFAAAGRKKLEEFRKKKAEFKKTKSALQSHSRKAGEAPKEAASAKPDLPSSEVRPAEVQPAVPGLRQSTQFAAPQDSSEGTEESESREPPANNQPQESGIPFTSTFTRRLPPSTPVYQKAVSPPAPLAEQKVNFAKPPPQFSSKEDHSKAAEVDQTGLPISSHASTSDNGIDDQDLPLSTAAADGYAALSDSYLSPSQATSAHSNGENRSLQAVEDPKTPQWPEESSASSSKPSLAELFGRPAKAKQESVPIANGHRAPSQAPYVQSRELEKEQHSAEKLANGRTDSSLPGTTMGRHGRTPSLNAWTDSSDGPSESTTEVQPPAKFSAESSKAVGQAPPLQPTVAAQEEVPLPPVKNGTFKFSRLPEPDCSFVPPWQPSSPKSSTTSFLDWKGRSKGDGKQSSPRAHKSRPLGLLPTNTFYGDMSRNGNSFEESRQQKNLAQLQSEKSEADAKEFASLQQHIGELTEQKFELARGLEKQQQMVSDLANENQRLLDDYNQQGQLVQQLRKELEQSHAEILAQRMALAGLGGERDDARSAFQGATQQAEGLATEVVALEEKFLKARSAELLATRQAEKVTAQALAAEQRSTATAAECTELRTMVAALQEEKRKWPEQLQKAASAQASALISNAETPTSKPEEKPEDGIPSRRTIVEERNVSRIAQSALQYVRDLPPVQQTSEEAEPDMLQLLLPPKAYRGLGPGQEAAELAAEERQVVISIHRLVDSLETEKGALLSAVTAQQEQNKKLQHSNAELNLQLETYRRKAGEVQKAITTSGEKSRVRPSTAGGGGRRGALEWIANIVAPRSPT